MILCKTDTKGRSVWIAQTRSEFEPYLAEFRERGERYRIVEREVSALGGTCTVQVLVFIDQGRG